MVTPPAAVSMVVVPVTSRPAVMVVAPITSRAAAIVSRVMPLTFTPMAVFPFPPLPITTPVIVPVAIPARANDDSRRLDINRRRRRIDRLGCIYDTGDADVDSNIDVCEGDGGCAYTEAGNQRHGNVATA
jgi:hypothetical protein